MSVAESNMKRAKVTEEVFDTIKLMLNNGVSSTKCCSVFHLAASTVSNIKKANSYAEYKEIIRQWAAKKKAEEKAAKEPEKEEPVEEPVKVEEPVQEAPQVVEHHQTITLIANQFMAEQLKKQTELLTLINNKLTLIAEDLGCFRDENVKNE